MALILLAEAATRVVEHLTYPDADVGALLSFVETHKVEEGYYWTFRPSTSIVAPERYGDIRYTVNSSGFRTPEPLPKSRKPRILFLGDSISFGLCVNDEEPFVRRLEQTLGVEAINLSIFAYHTLAELLVLKLHGLAQDPDLVVLQLYLNDFQYGEDYLDVTLSWRDSPRVLAALRNRIVNRSAVYRRIRQAGQMATYALFHDYRRQNPHLLNDSEPLQTMEVFRSHPDDDAFPAYRHVEEMRRLAEKIGAGFLVLLTPNETQLFNRDFDPINERIRSAFSRRGIELYDLLEELRSSPRKEEIFCDGLHFSAYGHRLVAEMLESRIRDESKGRSY